MFQLTKGQAQEKLDALIKFSIGQISGSLSADSTFAEAWKRYSALKSASWSTATRKSITSIFSGESEKKTRPSVLALLGARPVRELTRDPLQELLNTMARRGDSHSAVKKTRTYLAAALEYARDEKLIADNPARKLELPTKLLRRPCERYYTLEEVRRLLTHAHGREHLVLRIFFNCGLRPGELFALREDDVEPGQLRIDESVKESERGDRRIGETKTTGSCAFVGISKELQEELDMWIHARRQQRPYSRHGCRIIVGLAVPKRDRHYLSVGKLPETLSEAAGKEGWYPGHDIPSASADLRDALPKAWQAAGYPGAAPALETGNDWALREGDTGAGARGRREIGP